MKKTIATNNIIKLFKTSDKEKILKVARGKRHIMYRENKDKK